MPQNRAAKKKPAPSSAHAIPWTLEQDRHFFRLYLGHWPRTWSKARAETARDWLRALHAFPPEIPYQAIRELAREERAPSPPTLARILERSGEIRSAFERSRAPAQPPEPPVPFHEILQAEDFWRGRDPAALRLRALFEDRPP